MNWHYSLIPLYFLIPLHFPIQHKQPTIRSSTCTANTSTPTITERAIIQVTSQFPDIPFSSSMADVVEREELGGADVAKDEEDEEVEDEDEEELSMPSAITVCIIPSGHASRPW